MVLGGGLRELNFSGLSELMGCSGLLLYFVHHSGPLFLVSAFTVYSRTLGLVFYVKMYEIPRWENAMIMNVLCYGFFTSDDVK